MPFEISGRLQNPKFAEVPPADRAAQNAAQCEFTQKEIDRALQLFTECCAKFDLVKRFFLISR